MICVPDWWNRVFLISEGSPLSFTKSLTWLTWQSNLYFIYWIFIITSFIQYKLLLCTEYSNWSRRRSWWKSTWPREVCIANIHLHQSFCIFVFFVFLCLVRFGNVHQLHRKNQWRSFQYFPICCILNQSKIFLKPIWGFGNIKPLRRKFQRLHAYFSAILFVIVWGIVPKVKTI